MSKRICGIILAVIMCVSIAIPASAASEYIEKKLGYKADIVRNYGGYLMVIKDEAGYDKLYDLGGKVVFDKSFYYGGEGYYFTKNDDGILTVYDKDFKVYSTIDVYAITHGGKSIANGSKGIADTNVGYYFEYIAGEDVIAIVGDPMYILDYKGNVTGKFTADVFDTELELALYNDSYSYRVSGDGIITVYMEYYDDGMYNAKRVFVDKTGKVLYDLREMYTNVGALNEGLTWAFEQVGYDEDSWRGIYELHYIDKNGKSHFTADADYANLFFGERAIAGVYKGDDILYGLIDKNGKWVVQPQFPDIFGTQGIYAAQKNGKYGYIDSNGNVLVPFEYEDVSEYKYDIGYGVKKGEVYSIQLKSTPSDWAVQYVDDAVAAGLVPANLQSYYGNAITRAEFTALAVRLYETITGGEIAERVTFSDTSDVNVQKAAAIGVVNGVGGGKFSPDATLTREQAATMLARLANAMSKPLETSAASFADNKSASDWALEAIGQMQASGIMGGVGENKFAPKVEYTREQSIITIWRLFEILK